MRIGGIDGFPLILDLEGAEYSRFRVSIQGIGTLHFDECEVWAHEDGTWTNRAIRGEALQSSEWKKGFGPEQGNNGAITGDIGPHTKHEPNASWDVRFGKFLPCDYLVLFNRLRFHSERMRGISVFGHGRKGWTLLFQQSNPAHITAWGETVLASLDERMAAQLRGSIPPQASLAGNDAKARAFQSGRFYEHLERLEVLRRSIASVRLISSMLADPTERHNPTLPALQDAVRTGLRATMPLDLAPAPHDVFLFDVARFTKVHIRTRSISPTAPPDSEEAFELEFFDYVPSPHVAAAERATSSDPTNTFDYISCRMRDGFEFPVTATGLKVLVDSSLITNVKWEIWGEDDAGEFALLYDNTAVSRAIFQLQYLLERDDHPFTDLVLGSRALELEGKLGAAWMFSLYYPTTEPDTSELDDYLDQIEYRSFMDTSRSAVSRTKHGYRETFRFKDKPRFSSGIQLVAETVNEAGFRGVPFYGTLLGFLREGSLIDHDDDGDLLMLNDATSRGEMMEYRTTLLAWLEENTDWTIYRGENLPGKNVAVAFDHQGEWIHCDLFPTWVEDDQRMVLHEGRGGFVPLPAELFDADRSLEIEGATFDVPERSEELMELVYGDWRKPYRGYMLGFRYQVLAKYNASLAAAANAEPVAAGEDSADDD